MVRAHNSPLPDEATLAALWTAATTPLPQRVVTALGDTSCADALALLRLLHAAGAAPAEEFVSPHLSAKLARQLCDAVALTSGTLPSWCTALATAAAFLFILTARLGPNTQVLRQVKKLLSQAAQCSNGVAVACGRLETRHFLTPFGLANCLNIGPKALQQLRAGEQDQQGGRHQLTEARELALETGMQSLLWCRCKTISCAFLKQARFGWLAFSQGQQM